MTKASDKQWVRDVNDPAGAFSTLEGITLPDGVSLSKLKSGSYWQDSVSGYWVIYTGSSEAGKVKEYEAFRRAGLLASGPLYRLSRAHSSL